MHDACNCNYFGINYSNCSRHAGTKSLNFELGGLYFILENNNLTMMMNNDDDCEKSID